LNAVFRGKEKKEALAKLPESGYYWKVVTAEGGKYYPFCIRHTHGAFKVGWNTTKRGRNCGKYTYAYHLCRDKSAAEMWLSPKEYKDDIVIRCKVKKKDIIHIGEQDGLCIVTTRFWCPKPKGAKK